MKKSFLSVLIFSGFFWVTGCDSDTIIEDAGESGDSVAYSTTGADDSEQAGSYTLSFENNLIKLEAENADLREVLEELASKSGIEIDLGPGVRESISASFEGLPLEEALRRITPNYSLVFKKEQGQNEFRITKVVIAASSELTGAENPAAAARETGPDDKAITDQTGEDETGLAEENKTEDEPGEEETGSPESEEDPASEAQYVQDELVIRFKQDLTREEIESLIREKGASIKDYIEDINYYVLKLPEGLPVDEAEEFFQGKDAVEHVEPNYLIPVKAVLPNDEFFRGQWGLHNIGQTGGIPDADIDAVEAWNIQPGNAGDEAVIIAVIDTGVDYAHEDLAAGIWLNPGEIANDNVDNDANGFIDDTIGWDFVDIDVGTSGVIPAQGEDAVQQDNDPMDVEGHGTMVAGVAGAVTNNNKGIAGVARRCRIMPVRAGFKTSDGEGILEGAAAARAIIYSVRNGAKVINLSWGAVSESGLISESLKLAGDNGVLTCAAAGNQDTSKPIYPAGSGLKAIISIGATDHEDQMYQRSNYGDWVDVSGPGVSIATTYPGQAYVFGTGTSLATPHAAGLAALLFSRFENITAQEVKARIMSSVDVLESLEGKNMTGGRINALNALTSQAEDPVTASRDPSSIPVQEDTAIATQGTGGGGGGCFISGIIK